MSGPTKKKRAEDEVRTDEPVDDAEDDDGSSGNSDSESEEELMDQQEVEVDFEARTPEDCDFDGIKQLLHQLFLSSNINITELAELIIQQNYIGSIVRQTDDVLDISDDEFDDLNEVFGITTLIDLNKNTESSECLSNLRTFLLEKVKQSKNDKAHQLFRSVLEEKKHNVGFLINERYINIPAKISVPLLETLSKEMDDAARRKQMEKLDYFVMICKVNKLKEDNSSRRNNATKPDELIWTNAEEEIIAQHSLFEFDYSVSHQHDSVLGGSWKESDSVYDPWRKVLIFNNYESVVQHVRDAFVQ